MNPKTTIVLLVVLLIVGAYFVFVERGTVTTYDSEQAASGQRQEDGTALFGADQLSTESVVSVTIRRGQSPPVVLEKEGQDWYQTQPVRFALNTWSARQVVDDAAALRYLQKFDPKGANRGDLPTLEQASLSPPQAVVILEMEGQGATRQEIRLGRRAIGGRGYAMFGDNPHIYVVNDALHRQVLDSQVTDWRKRAIDAPTLGQAQRVILVRQGQSISTRQVEGRWWFDAPHDGRVDAQVVSGLLAAVGQIHIDQFVADSPDDISIYGLDKPQTELKVYLTATQTPGDTGPAATQPKERLADLASGRPMVKTLRIGSPVDLKNEKYFATWTGEGDPGLVMAISASDVEKFDKLVDDLRDPRVAPIKAVDVRELTIQRSEISETIKLTRGAEGWSFVAPGPGFEADSGAVSSLVESIVEAKAQGYQPVADSMSPAWVTVTLGAIGRPEPDVLQIYLKDEQGRYPVLPNRQKTIYLVGHSDLEKLFEPVAALRQKTVLDLNVDAVNRFMITHASGRRYVFDRNESKADSTGATSMPAPIAESPATGVSLGPWRLVGHDHFESEAFDQLLTQFLPLRTQGWPSETAKAAKGHPTPTKVSDGSITVQLEAVDGRRYTVKIDLDRHLGLQVGQSDKAEWFELNSELINLLGQEFRLRTLLPLSIDDIEHVQVIRSDRSVTIKRSPSATYVAQDNQPIDQSAAGALFDTLSGLRIKRFVQAEHISQPPLRIVLKTNAGQIYRLAFAKPDGQRHVATDGQQWFTLDADTFRKIDAPLAAR